MVFLYCPCGYFCRSSLSCCPILVALSRKPSRIDDNDGVQMVSSNSGFATVHHHVSPISKLYPPSMSHSVHILALGLGLIWGWVA